MMFLRMSNIEAIQSRRCWWCPLNEFLSGLCTWATLCYVHFIIALTIKLCTKLVSVKLINHICISFILKEDSVL
jgi:hypothetical protein